MIPVRLRHGRVELALHTLRQSDAGRPLLLLHGRAERSPDAVPTAAADWPGPIHALDFTGHGASSIPRGGGYTAELLMADADAALAHLGHLALLGRGLGAYVALLLAGARPNEVRGAVLCDGPGLAGGGPRPVTPSIALPPSGGPPSPDPFVLVDLARDVRPPDYAVRFVHQANQLSKLARPISVCAVERPDWLAAVVEEPGVEVTRVNEALEHYASVD